VKNLITLIAAAGLAAPLLSQPSPEPPKPCIQLRASFGFIVHAPYAVTSSLFGPIGERTWADEDWDPKFIYPQPANDQEGAVFTVSHGTHSTVWVNTLFDLEARHFQYVYFLPELMAATVDVRFKTIDAGTTQVNVVYTRTALTPEANEHVAKMSEGDKKKDKEWQQAIDNYLARMKSGQRQ
jgi:hypothetical protein